MQFMTICGRNDINAATKLSAVRELKLRPVPFHAIELTCCITTIRVGPKIFVRQSEYVSFEISPE